MSTRGNIYVEFGKTKLYLYRHCDSYPSETGADLLKALHAAIFDAGKLPGRDVADRFVRQLLAQTYEPSEHDKGPRQVFEITTALHGDIEWLYAFKFSAREYRQQHLHDFAAYPKAVRVAFAPVRYSDDMRKVLRELKYGSPKALLKCVNTERAETLTRAIDRKLTAENLAEWREAYKPIEWSTQP